MRDQQIELAALAAVGKAPGVQVAIQDTESGFRVLLSALIFTAGGESVYLSAVRRLEILGHCACLGGCAQGRTLAVHLDKHEWERALLRAMTGAKSGVAVHTVPACVPEEICEPLGCVPMVRVSERLPLAQPATIYGETTEEVRP